MKGVAVRDGETEPLLELLDGSISRAFAGLRRTVQKNLAVATVAFLRLLGSARSGHGQLSLAALFRVLPTSGTPHAREKRLHRFLQNPGLDPRGVTNGLARLILGRRGRGLWPVLFDQTKAGAVQALIAGVPYAGRTLPLAVYTFTYPWQEHAAHSQNQLEQVFLCDLETALPPAVHPVFVGDRGYARAALLHHCNRQARLYLIRGRAGTGVSFQGQKRKLAELRGPRGTPLRFSNVQYQARDQVPVDVIFFHDPAFQQPWWLLVPPHSESILPTRTVVDLYRQRMQVEQSFRDFKTHLGLRGLRLKVDVAQRTGRLLLAFCIAYCLALVLGLSPEAQQARTDLEIPRRRARHGTCRTLSVLTLSMHMLAHPRWRGPAYRRLTLFAVRVARGQSILLRAPPRIR